MKRREMKLLLEERFERIALLETRIDTMDQLVEGYRAREQAILDTLQSAKERTAKMLQEASVEAEQTRAAAKAEAEQALRAAKNAAEQALTAAREEAERTLTTVREEAERMRSSAKEDADALLTDAAAVSGTLRADAERRTSELVAIAKADSDRMLRDVEIIKREYEEMVESFNAMLAQNATELEVTAARFAEFVKDRKIDPPEIRMDGDAFYKSVGVLNDASLPDASGDPAMLMQNIYRIQNRPLPEDFMEERAAGGAEGEEKHEGEPVEERESETPELLPMQKPVFPMEDGNGADERQTTTEPYSEAAWVNETQESKSEPQAEFTKAFENAYMDSGFVVRADACQFTQESAVQAFDAAFSTPSFAEQAAAVAIPAALAAGVAPQVEAEQVFDEFFGEHFDPSGKAAQDTAAQDQTTAPGAAKPEPYSEAAWATGAFTSDHEPQAEGGLFSGELERETAPVTAGEVPATDAGSVIDDYFASFDGGSAAMAEPVAKPEPYSEAAWATGAFMSDHEPQAEGGLFSGEPERETAPVTAGEVPAPDADALIDNYFANYSAFGPASATLEPELAVKPEPYSGAAWATGAFTSDHEPQAEGGLFSGELENEEEAAQPMNQYAAEATSAFDNLFPSFGASAALESELAVKPEPYSGAAWATGAFTSDHEPQAEGNLYAEEEDEEPAPAPRKYNEYGEVREWEPEPEPDMGDIPTVSRYMGQSAPEGEISLDELLDEIIKAGE
ncbi:MAG: hypothetical protein VB062_03290 [Christensenella sp.]|nr:hypothetical protein [Christensenella sp.]